MTSAPASASDTDCRARFSSVASLSTSSPSSTPQWPWSVYSQKQTSAILTRPGTSAVEGAQGALDDAVRRPGGAPHGVLVLREAEQQHGADPLGAAPRGRSRPAGRPNAGRRRASSRRVSPPPRRGRRRGGAPGCRERAGSPGTRRRRVGVRRKRRSRVSGKAMASRFVSRGWAGRQRHGRSDCTSLPLCGSRSCQSEVAARGKHARQERSPLMNPIEQLTRRQLLVVTGKGGVGKTVVSATLGRALAAAGRRTLVVEVDPRENLHQMMGTPPSGGDIVAGRAAALGAEPQAPAGAGPGGARAAQAGAADPAGARQPRSTSTSRPAPRASRSWRSSATPCACSAAWEGRGPRRSTPCAGRAGHRPRRQPCSPRRRSCRR